MAADRMMVTISEASLGGMWVQCAELLNVRDPRHTQLDSGEGQGLTAPLSRRNLHISRCPLALAM